MATATKPTIDDLSDACHNIPDFDARVEYAMPPRALIPADLHPLLDDLIAAHAVAAEKAIAYKDAIQAAKNAKAEYNHAVDREVQPGENRTSSTFDRTDAAATAEKHARRVYNRADARKKDAHWKLTAAIAERKDEILALIQSVADRDAADEAAALAALATVRYRMDGVRSVRKWITGATPGGDRCQPHRARN